MTKCVRWTWFGTLVLLFGLSAVGCGNDETAPPDPGTLVLNMIDAPAMIDSVEAVTLVLSDVRVHANADSDTSDGGWIDVMPDTLSVAQRTFNLLDLVNGAEAVLGETLLDPGIYSQIRLVIEEASLTRAGVTYPLTIPSGMQSGLKLTHPFEIRSNETTSLKLDFDAGRSIYETPPGSRDFQMVPTIRVLQEETTGGISGTVLPLDIGAQVMAVSSASGDTVTTTFVDMVDGGYQLGGLPAGDYDVTAMAGGYMDSTAAAISVVVGSTTAGVDFELQPTP